VHYPKNLAPTGPISMIRVAKASPSIKGGGFATLLDFTSRHVTRIGIVALRGGTIIRTPLCLHPFIAPPRASTRKLIKNLQIRIFVTLRIYSPFFILYDNLYLRSEVQLPVKEKF
ncbi:hypothetical protein X777_01068, partial [Ooceraea biroi]